MKKRISMVVYISYMLEEMPEYTQAVKIAEHFSMEQLDRIYIALKKGARHGKSNIGGVRGGILVRNRGRGEGDGNSGAPALCATQLIA